MCLAKRCYVRTMGLKGREDGRWGGMEWEGQKWLGRTTPSIYCANLDFCSFCHRGAAILIRKNVLFTPGDVFADTNGRYIIVSGTLYQKPVVLVSVYAPNWDDHAFMKTFLSSLPNLNSHALIMGGDMNCVSVA